MRAVLFVILILCSGLSKMAFSQSIRVVVDIAPVHGLVSQVMKGVSSPDLMIDANASPHDYALRPSQARALSEADVVFWTGPALTPWLAKTQKTLAPNARLEDLSTAAELVLLPTRELPVFLKKHGANDEHDHDHDDHHNSDNHTDPHLWLDPQNAEIWLSVIAENLSVLDPKNKKIYLNNARQAIEELRDITTKISNVLKPVKSSNYIVFHDAYQYFENRFGLVPTGAISQSDATSPSAARITEIGAAIEKNQIVCVFAEPQFDTRLIDTVFQGSSSRVGVLDPIGATIPLGVTFYPELITQLAQTLSDCLKSTT